MSRVGIALLLLVLFNCTVGGAADVAAVDRPAPARVTEVVETAKYIAEPRVRPFVVGSCEVGRRLGTVAPDQVCYGGISHVEYKVGRESEW